MVQQEPNYVLNSPIKMNNAGFSQNNLEMSPLDKKIASRGEDNQGDYLIGAKERNSDCKQKRCKSSSKDGRGTSAVGNANRQTNSAVKD